ncbi:MULTISPECIES: Rnf-Nqr domain containing protein [unclassified Pseudomonas]|uniref:Rnf-Nqr domain containing protein n=1 Tax=unclassified Pseudomonas TaxID=196821 RepID=UPI00244B13E5|nr:MULTISPECIES: Rnf-Nqr domain containing protein [unclassified Pseudomonas]MDH0303989.1 NADH:quinone oxidoreductase [Pseudomonas sp. GD04091]MDH1986162.1 NADH:quinone oxidoreductase [Pseudomonas sp. GD03689]
MTRFWLLSAALTPVLGATATLLQALSIALCAMVLTGVHQLLMAPLRRHLEATARRGTSLVLACALTVCLQLGLQAWALPLAQALGHFPTLLALTCLASDQLLPNEGRWRTLLMGLAGLLAVSLALGLCRQLLAEHLGLHIARLAPGALILLGLLLGLYNHLRPQPIPPRRQGSL